MRQEFHQVNYRVYDSIHALSEKDNVLVSLACDQLNKAYAPYSQFHVGAAVRLINDLLFVGCNQENASYPLCICGERVALYNAGANYPQIAIESLAITVHNLKTDVNGMVTPCGACRQVIAEFESRHQSPIRILLKSDSPEIYEFLTVKDLLPFGFNETYL